MLVGAALALILAVGLTAGLRAPLNGDSAFLLWMARRVAHGAVPYRDVFDINPPLIVWLQIPLVRLAEALGVSAELVVKLAAAAVALASIAATSALVRRIPGLPAGSSVARGVSLTAAFALVAAPLVFFAEREHLVVALVLPFVVLQAGRVAGVRWSRPAAFAAGLSAGVGFSIKPQYGLVWAGLALWGWWAVRNGRGGEAAASLGAAPAGWALPTLLQPEWVALMGAGLIYLLAVAAFTPQYFGYARLVGPLYRHYRAGSPGYLLLGDLGALVVWLGLTLWLVYGRRRPAAPLSSALAISAAGFLAGAVLQGKGFGYHYYPAFVAGLLMLSVLAFAPAVDGRTRRGAILAGLPLTGLVLLFGYRAAAQAARPPSRVNRAEEAVRQLPPALRGRPALVIAPRSVWIFDSTGVAEPATQGYLLILPTLYRAPLAAGREVRFNPPDSMPAVERWYMAHLVHDVTRFGRPVLLVQRPALAGSDPEQRLDMLAVLERDPAFRGWFGGYREVDDVPGYRVFEHD